MNTYNISVKGNEILSQVPQSNLQENMKTIRGLVWTSGGNDGDIQVELNKDENWIWQRNEGIQSELARIARLISIFALSKLSPLEGESK